MPKTYKFHLPGITCAACIKTVKYTLNACEEISIENVSINLLDKYAYVTVADTSFSQKKVQAILKATIENANYDAFTVENHWLKGIIGLLSGSSLLALSLFGAGIPLMAMYAISALSVILTIYLGKTSYLNAINALVQHKPSNMDTLFSLSTFIALTVSIASFFFPWLPVMFPVPLLIFGFRQLGKAIEEMAIKDIKHFSFSELLDQTVEKTDGTTIAVKDLSQNDVIIVKKGKIIPKNGLCLSEKASIYDKMLKGLTEPQEMKKNDLLYAGMRVDEEGCDLTMQITTGSYLEFLEESIEQAQINEAASPLVQSAEKILDYFIPALFIFTLIAAITIGMFFPPAVAIQCAVTIPVSACPCIFGLIIALAIRLSLIKAGENGVQCKSGKSLEAAANTNAFVFDYTGTLTIGIPEVIHKSSALDDKTIITTLAAIERQSQRPIAKAITKYIDEKKLESKEMKEIEISYIDRSNQAGLVATIHGEKWTVGNHRIMKGIDISAFEEEIKQKDPNNQAEHKIFFARGKKAIGYLLLHDPLRSDAKGTIDGLKHIMRETKKESQIYIISGVDSEILYTRADELGIPRENVRANCLADSEDPNEKNTKTKHINQLIQEGRQIAMIGDGNNDLPAMLKAQLSIAVHSIDSHDITKQTADAIVYALWPITTLFTVAHQTVRNIKQNMGFSIIYNFLAFALFGGLLVSMGIVLNPAIGPALMICGTSLALINAYSLKYQAILTPMTKTKWQSSHAQLACYPEAQIKPTPTPTHTRTMTSSTTSTTPSPLPIINGHKPSASPLEEIPRRRSIEV